MSHTFQSSLNHLLPPGKAYPRYPEAVVQKIVQGMAAMFDKHHVFVNEVARQWFPQHTCTRLEEWEEALSLPDTCTLDAQTFAQRRQAVLTRLGAYAGSLVFENGSTASLLFLTNLVALAGYDVTLSLNHPFRVGCNRVGQRLGINAILHVSVNGTVASSPGLECLLSRLAPARYQLNFVYL